MQTEDLGVSSTTAWAFYTRDNRRLRVPASVGGLIVFEQPAGLRRAQPLVDISREGLAFCVAGSAPPIHGGMPITRVVVRFGTREVAGELRLAHVTPVEGGGAVCGGRFIPRTDADRSGLSELLAALETAVGR